MIDFAICSITKSDNRSKDMPKYCTDEFKHTVLEQ